MTIFLAVLAALGLSVAALLAVKLNQIYEIRDSHSAPVYALFYRLEHGPWYLRKPDGLKLGVDGLNSHSVWTLSDESDFEPALDVITDGKTRTVRLITLHPKMDEYLGQGRLDQFIEAVAPWWKVKVSQPKNGESVG